MYDAVAQRYSCLPSVVREADPYNIRILALLQAAGHFGGSEFTPVTLGEGDPLADLPMELA